MATALRTASFLILCAAVVASQAAYDSAASGFSLSPEPPSAEFVRSFDLGLHSAAASLFWVDVRTELPFLPKGPEHFLSGLRLVNGLDAAWSVPYAFTVLVLPNVLSYKDRVAAALAVGERGLAADPDWRIPFYMGTIYQLELGDRVGAAKYFDLAAATPGIPEIVRRFAINYGIHPDSLETTKNAWKIIYGTSRDEVVRTRAAAHISHLEILEDLNAAVGDFHAEKGRYPTDLQEVVRAGILDGIPQDPLGFDFKIYANGIVGIAP